jgi:catechol 2,3-dioxygenase-like lactoylglutathione lyase family enzyme
MSKQREGEPWMAADEYGRSLRGLTVNLLVRNMSRTRGFQTQVLGAEELYFDADFAAYEFNGAQWMLHADHTYDGHPLHAMLEPIDPRGIGAELRLHGRDPDEAVRVALELDYTVLQEATDKPHGTREAFILDADGYLWVPDVPR